MTKKNANRTCSVPLCDERHFGHGLCARHYRSMVRTGCVYGRYQRSEYAGLISAFKEVFNGRLPESDAAWELIGKLEEYVYPNGVVEIER